MTTSTGSTTVKVWMTANDGIELFTIGGGDVFHITDILQTPLYLERDDASINQLLETVTTVHILQRQQITVTDYHFAISIKQVELHPAELGTLTTVG